jgi:hypothetical protein
MSTRAAEDPVAPLPEQRALAQRSAPSRTSLMSSPSWTGGGWQNAPGELAEGRDESRRRRSPSGRSPCRREHDPASGRGTGRACRPRRSLRLRPRKGPATAHAAVGRIGDLEVLRAVVAGEDDEGVVGGGRARSKPSRKRPICRSISSTQRSRPVRRRGSRHPGLELFGPLELRRRRVQGGMRIGEPDVDVEGLRVSALMKSKARPGCRRCRWGGSASQMSRIASRAV